MALQLKLCVLLLIVASAFAARQQRVIRGVEARPHEFKSIVIIQAKHKGVFQHSCAGTLIDKRTVLTAAHCKMRNGEMRVIAGAHKASEISVQRGIQIANVAEQRPHKSFDWDFASNDIMILKLASDIHASPVVEFVRLPAQAAPYPATAGTACTLAGWGMTSPTSQNSDVLRKGPLTAVPTNPPRSSAGRRKDMSTIYATPGGDNQSSGCAGDSGGPLYCPANDGGAPIQVGVMSGGEGICGPKDKDARFARVSYLLPWINQHK